MAQHLIAPHECNARPCQHYPAPTQPHPAPPGPTCPHPRHRSRAAATQASAVMAKADTIQEQLTRKFEQLSSFLEEKKLPHQLKVRIRRHFRFYWQRTLSANVVQEEELINQM